MTNFMSPVDKIDHLFLEPVPTGRPISVVKAVRDGNVTILLAADGKVYSSRSAKVSYTIGTSEIQTSTMRALQRLGVITKAQMDKHLAAGEARSKLRSKRYAADGIKSAAETLGITLTKKQAATIDAYSTKKANSK